MSNKTWVLFGMIALVAFAVGIITNSARVDDRPDTQSLLTARLIDEAGNGTVAAYLGELTLVNFWASWCAPCREEMPVFEAMYRRDQSRGFTVVGIAIDSPDKTREMLDSMGITYPILYAETTGMQLMENTGNPQGLLPYSLLLDRNGLVLDQVLGRINEQQIIEWVERHL
ncbi:MAG: TlpA family protein disulfide reductase [Arenicella sp.]|nr:TlpA family protein disulfide reductase [Arenicella sp.]